MPKTGEKKHPRCIIIFPIFLLSSNCISRQKSVRFILLFLYECTKLVSILCLPLNGGFVIKNKSPLPLKTFMETGVFSLRNLD